MKQSSVSQKILGISGVILAILVLIGWYLYGAQQNRLQSLADEGQEIEQMLSEALDQSQNEVNLLGLRIQKLTEDLSAVRVSLTDEQRLRIQLQSLADESQAKEQMLSEALDQSQSEVKLLSLRIQKLAEDLSAEQVSLAEEQRLRIQLQTDLAQTHTDKKQIEQSMQDKVQSITATSSELEKELQRQLSLQEKLNSEIGVVSDEKSELLDRIENEQENQLRLQQQIDRVKYDVGQKETALATAEQESSRLNMQLSQTREERSQLENKVEKLNQQREMDARHFAELEDRLKRELNESRVEISQFKNQMTVIKLTSEVLFNSGSARIQPNGQKVLALIAESLNAYPDRAISIEGHSDNVAIGKRASYASNWELSTARALAAVNFFLQDNQMDPQRLQVVGHGEFQPVSSNETVEGRQLNRRIEIRLMPESQVLAEQ